MNTTPFTAPIVAFLSFHAYESRRRAGFHWLADAYARAGFKVYFVTVGLSPFSFLRNDYRLEFVHVRGANKPFTISDNVSGYYWFHPFHPINLHSRFTNHLCMPLFRLYAHLPFGRLAPILRGASRIVVESSLALAFAPRLRHISPKAKIIYRVSDDVTVIGAHPVVAEFERDAVPAFDLISIPSAYMRDKFPPGAPVVIQPHGLAKDLLDAPHPDPYPRNGRRRTLAMGTMLFDVQSFVAFAEVCPEIDFHFFGAIDGIPVRKNIILHGERPFREIVPYIQHADVGLAPYRPTQGASYLAHTSNKLMQFTWCRLPILLPDFISHDAAHVISYNPDDVSGFRKAMEIGLYTDRTLIDRAWIKDWSEVIESIEQQLILC